MNEAQGRRARCAGCSRPATVCACAWFPNGGPIKHDTNLRIVVLQHPHERKHSARTDWILQQCIEHVEICVSRAIRERTYYVERHPELLKVLEPLWATPEHCALVFPENAAPQSSTAPIGSAAFYDRSCAKFIHSVSTVTHLFAIDATWKYAREMLKSSLALKTLRRLSLSRELGVNDGAFVIRKAPIATVRSASAATADYSSTLPLLSTAEAVASAVDLLVDGKIGTRTQAVRVVCEQVSRMQFERFSRVVHRPERRGYQRDLYAQISPEERSTD
mmetsp:Transcript_12281/g.33139  ORF Transcript_12281/g.33139 Transcript_12281/m.33139 type:complete len:276 (-) Transcript_12281:639-1466(-)